MTASTTVRPPILPLFVCGFLIAIVVRSTGVLSAQALHLAGTMEKVVLTVALVGLGMGVRLDRMRKLGGRPAGARTAGVGAGGRGGLRRHPGDALTGAAMGGSG